MRPSITAQLDAQLIPNAQLKQSPRNYNPSICEINGRLWMAYRSHRPDGRCGIAICEDPLTGKSGSQWLDLGGATGKEHHEDPRLFVFAGDMHVAFIETTFPARGNYIAVQKYARLKRDGKSWKVAEVFRPRFGNNYTDAQEKNWQFFEHSGKLRAIYSHSPFVVIELAGDKVVNVSAKQGIEWPWGEIRGGTPPVEWNGKWLTFFHSSTPSIAGAWRRYWMGALVFDNEYNVVQISNRPLAGGSELDDHGHDPRVGSNWKPYVVFPGGAVTRDWGWLVALGINDWRCAFARIPSGSLNLCAPGTQPPPRYFKTPNGSRPLRMMRMDRSTQWLNWDFRPRPMLAGPGYMMMDDPWIAEEMSAMDGIQEIDRATYENCLKT